MLARGRPYGPLIRQRVHRALDPVPIDDRLSSHVRNRAPQSMSELPDAELRQSARRSARCRIEFGTSFVALGGVLIIVS